MGAAGDAIRRHMEALVEELTEILHTQVLEPYRREPHSPEDAAKLERTMARLRQLTLEAVVTGFQRAANAVITALALGLTSGAVRRSFSSSSIDAGPRSPSR